MTLGVIAVVDHVSRERINLLTSRVGLLPLPAHVTLAGGFDCNAPDRGFRDRIEEFASQNYALPIDVASVGFFGSENEGFVAFLAPVITTQLLEFHRALHKALAEGHSKCVDYYLPDKWVPHITLGANLNKTDLASTLLECATHWRPFSATLNALALVEHPPSTVVALWPLAIMSQS